MYQFKITENERRRYRFDTISNSYRLQVLSDKTSLGKAKEVKNELDKFKVTSGFIEVEGGTPFLKMASKNWNFLYEGEDFEVSLLGNVNWIDKDQATNKLIK